MNSKLFLAAAAFALSACCNQKCSEQQCQNEAEAQPEATECETPKFNDHAFPQKGVDVNAFSTGIQHIGIPTSDIQKTIDFYTGLGFTLASRKDIGGRDFAFLQLGNLVIEAIPNDNPKMDAGSIDHICLDAKNIAELFQQLKDAGYQLLNEDLVDFDAWENGTKLFFIMGPNNEKLEFCEIL